MEEDDVYEKIGRLRGNIEGYELKVKPMVEVVSAMLSVFEEKIKINPALALKARDTKFSERLSETLSAKIMIHFNPDALLVGVGADDPDAEFGIMYCILEKGKVVGIGEKDEFCELLILYGKEKKLINWLSEIFETIEGFREIAIEGLRAYIETVYPVRTVRRGKTIYCKRDLKGEDRWIPTRIEIENTPPTERGTSAITMRIKDNQSNEWKANLYFYEPEGLMNMINELTKGIGYILKQTTLEVGN